MQDRNKAWISFNGEDHHEIPDVESVTEAIMPAKRRESMMSSARDHILLAWGIMKDLEPDTYGNGALFKVTDGEVNEAPVKKN